MKSQIEIPSTTGITGFTACHEQFPSPRVAIDVARFSLGLRHLGSTLQTIGEREGISGLMAGWLPRLFWNGLIVGSILGLCRQAPLHVLFSYDLSHLPVLPFILTPPVSAPLFPIPFGPAHEIHIEDYRSAGCSMKMPVPSSWWVSWTALKISFNLSQNPFGKLAADAQPSGASQRITMDYLFPGGTKLSAVPRFIVAVPSRMGGEHVLHVHRPSLQHRP